MSKLTLTDTFEEVLLKLAEGNPGAISVIFQIVKNARQYDPQVDPMMYLMYLDELGYRGSALWELYKDVCGESLPKLLTYLRGVQLGMVKVFQYFAEKLNFEEILKYVQEGIPSFVEGGFTC